MDLYKETTNQVKNCNCRFKERWDTRIIRRNKDLRTEEKQEPMKSETKLRKDKTKSKKKRRYKLAREEGIGINISRMGESRVAKVAGDWKSSGPRPSSRLPKR